MPDPEVFEIRSIPELEDQISDLPVLPTVGLELMRMTSDVNATSAKLAAVLEQDPGLVTKVLRLANSAYYGLRNPVKTVAHAISLLGMIQIRTMSMDFTFLELSSRSLGTEYFLIRDYFSHSLACAQLSQRIMKKFRISEIEPEEAYVAGLLHDIGAYVLSNFYGELYRTALDEITSQGEQEMQIERSRIGYHHCEVGAWIADKWRLPPHIIEAVGCHHLSPLLCENKETVAVVQLADHLISLRGVTYLPMAESPQVSPDTLDILAGFLQSSSPEGVIASLIEELGTEIEETTQRVENVICTNEQTKIA